MTTEELEKVARLVKMLDGHRRRFVKKIAEGKPAGGTHKKHRSDQVAARVMDEANLVRAP
jgi:hypothetical protein